MKWIRVAIGVVIAIVSVGIIATSVNSMTQENEVIKEVEFTVNTAEGIYTPNVYENIVLYSDIGGGTVATNISMVKLNNVITNDLVLRLHSFGFAIYSTSQSGECGFNPSGTINNEDAIFQDGDIVSFSFEVTQPPQLTGVVATLILLAPLIFVGGVLGYLLYKQNGLQE